MINNRDGNWTSIKSETFINRLYQLNNCPDLFIITYDDNWTAEYTIFTFILCDGFKMRYFCSWEREQSPEEIYNYFIDDWREIYHV